MYKATVYNTVRLTGDLSTPTVAEEAQLQALIDSVKRTSPDKAKHDTTFDLDDLLTYLVEDDEATSHIATRNNFQCKDARARARGRAVVTLKTLKIHRVTFSVVTAANGCNVDRYSTTQRCNRTRRAPTGARCRH